MLVLSRKAGESIVIDPGGLNIVIRNIGFYRGAVKLGVEAPQSILVLRSELIDSGLDARAKPSTGRRSAEAVAPRPS